jgi:hypothetical protein
MNHVENTESFAADFQPPATGFVTVMNFNKHNFPVNWETVLACNLSVNKFAGGDRTVSNLGKPF